MPSSALAFYRPSLYSPLSFFSVKSTIYLYQSTKTVEKESIEGILCRSQNHQDGWTAMASSVISRIIPCLVGAFLLPLLNIRHCSSHRCHWDFHLLHILWCHQKRSFVLPASLHTKLHFSPARLHLRFQAQVTGLGFSHKGTEKVSDQVFSVSVDSQWNMRRMRWSASSDKQTKEQMSTVKFQLTQTVTRH